MDRFYNFTGKINRRTSATSVDPNSPRKRLNLLSRDKKLSSVPGVESYVSGFNATPTWGHRYHTTETGIFEPKSFVYSQDGVMSVIDDNARTRTNVTQGLNTNAYPRSWDFKLDTITYTYLVDGLNLWKTNGNNQNQWEKVDFVDALGQPVKPIDVVEHLDRLIVVSEDFVFVSKNLEPDNFSDATDSIQIIVGTGKGRNLGVGRIEDNLYIFNTEGIFALVGDVLSAVAETFEIRLVDDKVCVATGSLQTVEKAILFLADDLELYSWNGNTSTLLSYEEKLKDDISPLRVNLNKTVSMYDPISKYYKLSVVADGDSIPTLEYWYDALENKIDMLKGRNVSCYFKTDTSIENNVTWVGKSDKNELQREGGRNFDNKAPEIWLRSADLPIGKKGENGRVNSIYPQFNCTGNRTAFFRYLLDGRLSDAPTGGTSNAVLNPVFNDWSSGTNVAPDEWTTGIGSGITVAQSADSYTGAFSAQVSSNFLGVPMKQVQTGTTYKGYKMTFTCYVKSSAGSKSRIALAKTVSGGYTVLAWSQYHSGGGEWERLEVTYTLPDTDDVLGQTFLLNPGSDTTAKFDGAICVIEPHELANFKQNLSGENIALGFIQINNQAQTTDRIKPRIKYAKGETIAFEVVDSTKDMELELLGIGYDVILKGRKKNKKVGA